MGLGTRCREMERVTGEGYGKKGEGRMERDGKISVSEVLRKSKYHMT